jgi:hypothetical protein
MAPMARLENPMAELIRNGRRDWRLNCCAAMGLSLWKPVESKADRSEQFILQQQ